MFHVGFAVSLVADAGQFGSVQRFARRADGMQRGERPVYGQINSGVNQGFPHGIPFSVADGNRDKERAVACLHIS